MKKSILVSFFIIFAFAANAYDWDPSVYQVGKRYPGYIVTLEGDTINGWIKARMRCPYTAVGKSNQNYCEFYRNENDKKPMGKFKPDDLMGYTIADKVYRSIGYSGGLSKSKNFNLYVSDGHISTYYWYQAQEGAATMRKSPDESREEFDARRYTTSVVLQKGSDRPRESAYYMLSFAKRCAELVQEHEELAESVKSKEKGYRMLKFDSIIEEYNIWYAANN